MNTPGSLACLDLQYVHIHRLSQCRTDPRQPPRPIIAKYKNYEDPENVLKCRRELCDKKGLFIEEDFPKEICITRQFL